MDGKERGKNRFVRKRLNLLKWNPKISASMSLLLRALKKFDRDHGFLLSSGIAFAVLLCMIPLTFLLLALIGAYLFSEQEILIHIRDYLENILPSLDPQIMENFLRIMQDRQIVGILGVGGLAWTSTWVFSSLRTALNLIFEVGKGRGVLRGKAVDLFMVLLAGIFLLMSMVFTSANNFLQGYQYLFRIDIGPLLALILKYFFLFRDQGEGLAEKSLDFFGTFQRIVGRGRPPALFHENPQSPVLQNPEGVLIGAVVPEVQGQHFRLVQPHRLQEQKQGFSLVPIDPGLQFEDLLPLGFPELRIVRAKEAILFPTFTIRFSGTSR